MVAIENKPRVHNLVVCTLCSCHLSPVLGVPPMWYKSFAYRSRAARDPRGLLKEFGLEIPEDVEVRVFPEVPYAVEGRTEVVNPRIEELKAAIAAAPRNLVFDGMALELMSIATDGASEADWARALEQSGRYEY